MICQLLLWIMQLSSPWGPRMSREGRAPYLHILQWLSTTQDWTLNLDREVGNILNLGLA